MKPTLTAATWGESNGASEILRSGDCVGLPEHSVAMSAH
jgi:hypothetical protein